MLVAAFGLFLLALQQVSECPDVASCRQAALDAAARGEFESFHDLAWRAVQKGRPNDPALMVLVARAQSLSGRPGDALVMLRRLAQMSVATDAATSDDFRRVRALPGWPEVEAMLTATAKSADASAGAPTAGATTSTAAPGRAVKPAATASPPGGRTRSGGEAKPLPSIDEEALPLESIQPAGLAHDAVSRRFIVGDRRENKLVIFDEVFKRATDMTGAESGGFFGLTAIEIDPRRGDLWVANHSAVRGAALHKLQLVSGRVLFELPVPADLGPSAFVDLAVLADGLVLLLDAEGRRILGVSPARREFARMAAADVDEATSLASTGGRTVLVAHPLGILRVDLETRAASPVRGAPEGLRRIRAHGRTLVGVQSTATGDRIVRVRLDAAATRTLKVDVLDATPALLDASAITIVDGVAHYISAPNGSPVMRRVTIVK